jgi:hypothetical protein
VPCVGAMPCRGKIKSLQDASATTSGHVELLLGGVAAVCGSKAAGSADDVKLQAEKLQKVSGWTTCGTACAASCIQLAGMHTMASVEATGGGEKDGEGVCASGCHPVVLAVPGGIHALVCFAANHHC